MKKITIYGTSVAKFRSSEKSWGFYTYCEQLKNYFSDCIINWRGVNQCSLERLYLDIKKDKNSDLIIIFHGKPSYIYCPGLVKDISIDSIKTMVSNKENAKKGAVNAHTRQTGKDMKFILSMCYYYKTVFYDGTLRPEVYGALLSRLDKILMSRNVIHCSCISAHDYLRSGITIKETKEIFKQNHPVYYFPQENHNKLAQLLIGNINEYNWN